MSAPMLEYRIEEEGPVFSELWLLDDVPHREDGPACIMHRKDDGAVAFELWYEHGKLHREHGPAALYYDCDTGRVSEAHYFRKGELFRADDGPQSMIFDAQGRLDQALWYEGPDVAQLTWSRWLWLTQARAATGGGR